MGKKDGGENGEKKEKTLKKGENIEKKCTWNLEDGKCI